MQAIVCSHNAITNPRVNLTRYHGVLAPASSWRNDVVPAPPARKRPRSKGGEQDAPDPVALRRRYTWAELLKRTFELDLLTCACGAEREVIACISDRATAGRILRHLGLPDEPPVSAPSRAPPVLDFGA